MKKFLSLNMILVLLALCGCGDTAKNSNTEFLLDTFVTLRVECDEAIIEKAFDLCRQYEKMFSLTDRQSDVCRINTSEEAVTVSEDTRYLLERALYYGEQSKGAFDITIASVSALWDFGGDIIPDRSEIAEALQSVDYHSVTVEGNTVRSSNAQIDLGGIAKGFIGDKLREFFIFEGVDEGIINLGGNIAVFGDVERIIGIKEPFGGDGVSARVSVCGNYNVVTSGTYERYIECDGKKYHHILDPKTGYGAETDLVSATVIGKNGADCDALSTVCILLGLDEAEKIIENTADTEAVFITEDGKISHTSGIKIKNDIYFLN